MCRHASVVTRSPLLHSLSLSHARTVYPSANNAKHAALPTAEVAPVTRTTPCRCVAYDLEHMYSMMYGRQAVIPSISPLNHTQPSGFTAFSLPPPAAPAMMSVGALRLMGGGRKGAGREGVAGSCGEWS